ncbi:GNAT family N-acetyltransferase [Vallitalea guaymasensis]|uniref:GNAT family N-acetyltransferase n=1 Tax=Vallitalea guaymasensis TaxID=1185412 RepID=UPI002355B032|nr:GNAT family N-acetyltransferase [Vallitalea guaymasensis]
MEYWSKNREEYQLDKDVYITKACEKEFAIFESIYGDGPNNRFAIKHWDLRLAISLDTPFAINNSFYWIIKGDVKIGGVLIEPNVISRLFIIPPYNDLYRVLRLLKKLLIKWSDPKKNINAFQINNEQGKYFEMLGFWKEKSRRWMMRPTEELNYEYNQDFIFENPDKQQNRNIAKLLCSSFSNGVDNKSQLHKDTDEEYFEACLNDVNDFFENTNSLLLEASTVIYDAKDKKIVGVCLISLFEEWPLIHTIAIDPLYSGKGLGKIILNKGISILNREYQVVRLFVTIGNSAESVYHELGFVQGVEFGKYYLPNFNK